MKLLTNKLNLNKLNDWFKGVTISLEKLSENITIYVFESEEGHWELRVDTEDDTIFAVTVDKEDFKAPLVNFSTFESNFYFENYQVNIKMSDNFYTFEVDYNGDNSHENIDTCQIPFD